MNDPVTGSRRGSDADGENETAGMTVAGGEATTRLDSAASASSVGSTVHSDAAASAGPPVIPPAGTSPGQAPRPAPEAATNVVNTNNNGARVPLWVIPSRPTKSRESDNGARVRAAARRRAAGVAAFLRPRLPAGPPATAPSSEAETRVPSDAELGENAVWPAAGADDPDATAKVGDLLASLTSLDAPERAGSRGAPRADASPAGAPPAHAQLADAAHVDAPPPAELSWVDALWVDDAPAAAGAESVADAAGWDVAGARRAADAADASRLLVPIEQVPEPHRHHTPAWLETLRPGTFVHSSTGRATIALVAAVIVMVVGGVALLSVGPAGDDPSTTNAGFPLVNDTARAAATTAAASTPPPPLPGAAAVPPAPPQVEASLSSAPTRRPAAAAPTPRPAVTSPPARAPASPAAPPSTRPACYDQWPPILAAWLDQMGRC